MAEIGGFINLIIILIGVLALKYQEIDFKLGMVQELFHFKKRNYILKNENDILRVKDFP
jgi:hypothetical protein